MQRVFHPGNTTDLGAKVEVDSVLVWAVGGPYDEGYSFRFVAPYGAPLERRNYVAAQRSGFIDPGYPGMDVEGEGRGCNAILGNFEVRDIAVDAQGELERLWLVYEQHCEGDTAATWGEIRINAWVPDAQAAMAPGIVRWPAQDSWEQATAVPVTYRGGSVIESAAVVGPHAADYSVTAGGCLGHAGPCDVAVRFARTAPGTRRATLRLTDAEGRVHETALEGFAHDGATDAELEVLAGDVAGQPGTYRYDSTSAFFAGQNHGVRGERVPRRRGRSPLSGPLRHRQQRAARAGVVSRRGQPPGRPPLPRRVGHTDRLQPHGRELHGPLDRADAGRDAAEPRRQLRAALLPGSSPGAPGSLALAGGRRRAAGSMARARAAPADRRAARRPRPAGIGRAGRADACCVRRTGRRARGEHGDGREPPARHGVSADRRELARRAALHARAAAGRARSAHRCRGAAAVFRPLLLPPPLGAGASRPCRRRPAPRPRPLPPRDRAWSCGSRARARPGGSSATRCAAAAARP